MADLALTSGVLTQLSKWRVKSGGKVQNDIFSIEIYEFNIYLFFKKKGGTYWRGVLITRNTVVYL